MLDGQLFRYIDLQRSKSATGEFRYITQDTFDPLPYGLDSLAKAAALIHGADDLQVLCSWGVWRHNGSRSLSRAFIQVQNLPVWQDKKKARID